MPATRRARADVLKLIRSAGLIPVIRAESSELAIRITEALVEGGVKTVEITMTVPDAFAAIRAVSGRFGQNVVVGAGTVTDRVMVDGSLAAGAEFIVSPCVVPDVIAAARAHDVPVLPGAMTPTEVFHAWSLGGDIVKIFPASHVGGASYLKALKGPFPQIAFCPTGGVNLETLADFIKAGASAVGIGGELVLKSAIESGNFARLTELARQYVDAFEKARQSVS